MISTGPRKGRPLAGSEATRRYKVGINVPPHIMSVDTRWLATGGGWGRPLIGYDSADPAHIKLFL